VIAAEAKCSTNKKLLLTLISHSFAINEFPEMDDAAIETFWRAKVRQSNRRPAVTLCAVYCHVFILCCDFALLPSKLKQSAWRKHSETDVCLTCVAAQCVQVEAHRSERDAALDLVQAQAVEQDRCANG
jgi:hypothetical protein